jgi:hypothetical protein
VYVSECLILQVWSVVTDRHTDNTERVRRLIFRHEFINIPHSTLRKVGLFVAGAEEFCSEPLSNKLDASIFINMNHVSLTLTHLEPQSIMADTTTFKTIIM